MHGRDYKRGNNGFIHGFRYSIRALHKWMEQEIENTPWPVVWGGDEPWELTGRIHKRIRTTSGLYQMFGVMCDLAVFSEGQTTSTGRHSEPVGVAWMQEMPCDMVPHVVEQSWRHRSVSGEKQRLRFFTLSLDYARCYKDESVFTRTRFCMTHDMSCYSQTNFLHPIIRYYDISPTDDLRLWSGTDFEHKATREYHTVEDLATKWDNIVFTLPTFAFFERVHLERLGMSRVTTPLLMTERDTTLPQPHCDMEIIGDMFFHKAHNFLPWKTITSSEEAKVKHKFYLAQALKFKPALWIKIWGGPKLMRSMAASLFGDGSTDSEPTVNRFEHFEVAQAILDEAALRRRLNKLNLKRSAHSVQKTPSRCTTKGFSVEKCLLKKKKQNNNNNNNNNQQQTAALDITMSPKMTATKRTKMKTGVSWLKSQVIQRNLTNALVSSRPCFLHKGCVTCTSDESQSCAWCVNGNVCVHSDGPKTCPSGDLASANNINQCKCVSSVFREAFDWMKKGKKFSTGLQDNPFVLGELEEFEAFHSRVLLHPSNHSASLFTYTPLFSRFRTELTLDVLQIFTKCMKTTDMGKHNLDPSVRDTLWRSVLGHPLPAILMNYERGDKGTLPRFDEDVDSRRSQEIQGIAASKDVLSNH
jgi:hypothetical protein